MPTIDQVKIVDKRIYYITEADLSAFHEEEGWYCDITYSDEKIDTYGPYDSKDLASSLV